MTEVVTLLATIGLVWLSLWYLKRKETLANEPDGVSRKKDNEAEKRRTKRAIPVEVERDRDKAWYKGFRKRSNKTTTDLEQSLPAS